jgi:hypothetical protein
MDNEKISILRRIYAEGSAWQRALREQHPTLADLLFDLLTAAEFGNHIVSPQGIQAMAVGMCEVLYPELDADYRTPDEEDLWRAAKILLAQVSSAEAATKGRVS